MPQQIIEDMYNKLYQEKEDLINILQNGSDEK